MRVLRAPRRAQKAPQRNSWCGVRRGMSAMHGGGLPPAGHCGGGWGACGGACGLTTVCNMRTVVGAGKCKYAALQMPRER
jgi:hypothetical protein